ncbi:MAG TPA: hypothetical protein VN699_17650 [Pirellulales bacterium]|nr:hypothetical protein [Pirellulales bacterium]
MPSATSGEVRALAAVALGCAGGAVLVRAGRRLRGSTLAAPWVWSCFSLAALVGAEIMAAWLNGEAPSAVAVHLQYLAAMTMLTPFVAMLGAKRPQDRAWQWIVLSLLALLALPSLKAAIFDAGAPPAPHAAWRWLLAVMALAGLLNYLPTRYGVAAALFFGGQLLELAEYLPGLAAPLSGRDSLAGLGLAVAALLAAQAAALVKKSGAPSVDRLWLDFRDAFGVLWALRVAERFNAAAAQSSWRVWLGWSGLKSNRKEQHLVRDAGPISADVLPAMRQSLKNLLWRFVSPEWISERLGP